MEALNNQKAYFPCDIELIRPNPYQPRTRFSQDEIEELSRSIEEQGIIQPLLVRKSENGCYELITGQRRLRAAKMAGLNQIPVILKEISDADLLVVSIIENIQRKDLNPMEEARAYQRLMLEFNFTQEQVAKCVGKSRPAIANVLRLWQLPEQIRDSIMDDTLTMGHAKALLGAKTTAQQMKVWHIVLSKGLSVRETERLVKNLREKEKSPRPRKEAVYFSDIADDLSRYLGTKVQIKRHGKKGKLEIEFYNDDDLDRLVTLLRK